MNLIISPASEFTYASYSSSNVNLKCKTLNGSDETLFTVSSSYNLSSRSKLVFSLSPSMLEKLSKDEKYILSISGFNLTMGSQYLNSNNEIFELEWIYQ